MTSPEVAALTGSSPDIRIVVTMPAYNAEKTVQQTVEDLHPWLREHVILVDDASIDGTAGEAMRLGLTVIEHPSNRGYGGNQKTCYRAALEAGADIVVMLHPDYQYDPRAVPLLIAPLLSGDAEMTFGSRFAGMSDPRAGGMPRYRYVGNRLTTIVQNTLLGTRFTEMHSGMRAYTRDFLQDTPYETFSDGFQFDTQMMVHAITSGRRVVEVPIPTRYTIESSSIGIGPSLRYVGHAVVTSARARLHWGGRRARRMRTETGPVIGRGRRETAGKADACTICGMVRWSLKYPATTGDRPLSIDEFACTTSAVNVHDDIYECGNCGLMSSETDLDRDQIIEMYTEVTDQDYLAEEDERRRMFNWILGRLEDRSSPGDLLEFGSNVGLFLDVARGRGWNPVGIEPSTWAVAEGRRRFGVDLRVGTIEEAPLTGRYDAVVMLDVLEHLADPAVGLQRARRLLKDDGLLVLSTIDTRSVHARLRGARWPWFIRSHLHYFTKASLSRLLVDQAFQPVEWRNVPRSFHLSYVLHKGGWEGTWWGGAMGRMLSGLDPRVPAGWLGDIKLVVATPTEGGRGAMTS